MLNTVQLFINKLNKINKNNKNNKNNKKYSENRKTVK